MGSGSDGPWKLPVLSGLLLAAAHIAIPPLLVPNLVAFVPMLVWIDRNLDKPLADRLRAGLVFGLTTNLIILSWMYSMLEHSWLGAVLYVCLAAAFSAFAMAAVGLASWIRRSTRLPYALVLPACWISLEWSRTWTDLRMTADHMGHTLSRYPFLVQFADLVGPYGVGAFMLATNGLLYESVRDRGRRRGRGALACLAVLWAAVLAYDTWCWTRPPEPRATVTVGIVQPNIPLSIKHSLGTAAEQSDALARMTREAASAGAALVMWPETARPFTLRHRVDRPESFRMPEVQRLARDTGAAIVAGVEYSRAEGEGEPRLYNAAVVVHPDGRLDPVWTAKTYLVPFVEGVPFEPVLGPLLRGRGGELRWLGGSFERGPRGMVLRAAGVSFGVLVCYEELYFDLARDLRNGGAEFQAILTNDAWFGRSFFQPFQADSVRLRAIENRSAFVRVANTGISGFVDSLGRYHGRTGLDVPVVVVHDVPLAGARTIYDRTGDVVAWLAIAALAACVAASWRSPRSGASPPAAVRGEEGGRDELAHDGPDVGAVPGEGPDRD